jgi:3' terminal RNA ribose 2'-O-methyltransferase Hen1
VEIDPVGLVRGAGRFDQYVNDRPYAASSFLSVAMGRMFGTAMTGRSKERQDLADSAIALEARIPVLPCRGGESFLRSLFEPLGYELECKQLPLDENFPDWGMSAYFDVTLRKAARLQDLLNHLYVLIPVLDDDKHYWVGKDEIEKLMRKGEDWLETHPAKNEIVRRYLVRRKQLTREALERLTIADADIDPDAREERDASIEEAVEKPISLHEQRLTTVHNALLESGAHSILDLGCGEGKLLQLLLKDKQFEQIVGMDVSLSILNRAEDRLRLDRLPPMVAKKLRLIHGSLVYRDRRLEGFDAAALIEVIEHLDPPRLVALERNLFEFARPRTVVITTPNREYNVLFAGLRPVSGDGSQATGNSESSESDLGLHPSAGPRMRHRDHRFEWTRAEFEAWANRVAAAHRYAVSFAPIGPVDDAHGAPSQMAVFSRD